MAPGPHLPVEAQQCSSSHMSPERRFSLTRDCPGCQHPRSGPEGAALGSSTADAPGPALGDLCAPQVSPGTKGGALPPTPRGLRAPVRRGEWRGQPQGWVC